MNNSSSEHKQMADFGSRNGDCGTRSAKCKIESGTRNSEFLISRSPIRTPHSAIRIPHSAIRIGFTLIELLIVIAIIGILASLLLPALKLAKDASKKVLCASNLKQLYLYWDYYSSDYNGNLPPCNTVAVTGSFDNYQTWPGIMSDNLGTAVYSLNGTKMIAFPSFLDCPALAWTPTGYKGGIDCPAFGMNYYGIGGALNGSTKRYTRNSQIPQPSQLVAFGDSEMAGALRNIGCYRLDTGATTATLRHMGSKNILFCDGHVEPKRAEFFNPPGSWGGLAPWGNP